MTLRLVAEYGDMCNLIGSPDEVATAEAKLLEHCKAVGRDPGEIERTVAFRQPVIRNSLSEAEQVLNKIYAHRDSEPWSRNMVGTPRDLVDKCAPYIEMGYRHLIFSLLSPFDRESMERLATDVRPQLEAIVDTGSVQTGPQDTAHIRKPDRSACYRRNVKSMADEEHSGFSMGVGAAIGTAIGAAIFAMTGQPAWIGAGVALGAATGLITRRNGEGGEGDADE